MSIWKMCTFALFAIPSSQNLCLKKTLHTPTFLLTFACVWKCHDIFLFFILQVVSKFLEAAVCMRDYEVELFNQWKAETTQTLPLLMKRSVLIMVDSAGTVCVDTSQPNNVRCSGCLSAVRKRCIMTIATLRPVFSGSMFPLYSEANMHIKSALKWL